MYNSCSNFSFLFYDYETFGVNPSLDKVSQFACVRTDINFNILGKEYYFYCSLPNDYLPHPEAILLTGITPQYVQKHGLNEFFFSRKIFKIFNSSHTCIIGYNNLQFDDEITRNIFYRNLLDPYSWSWKNFNSRWDLICLVRACYVLMPHCIIWPKNKFGFTSFKLEDLAKSNNINHYAHDALSDVYTTIEIIRFIKKKNPELFNFFFKYRLKKNIKKLIDINIYQPMVYISPVIGCFRNYTTCIVPLFWNMNNYNSILFFDLYIDVSLLIHYLRVTQINDITITELNNLGVNWLNISKCPLLLPVSLFTQKKLLKCRINLQNCLRTIDIIKRNNIFFEKIMHVFKNYSYKNITNNVDLQIYNSFFSQYERNIMHKIHSIKVDHWKKFKFNFNNHQLEEIFFRLRARNFPELLNKSESIKWSIHLKKVFSIENLDKYFAKLQKLLNQYHSTDKEYILLSDLKKYVDSLISRFILK
ncbi:exodeoxyribonuclease I [Buchnera aphidicola]|uniref:exodeoxyribonuclease I n=1 Tax=Buchnera aphidicola TaxID=9 RepID=UPI00165110DA|nr:exodeoxyribonuclease I [Buchnera aphidicola]